MAAVCDAKCDSRFPRGIDRHQGFVHPGFLAPEVDPTHGGRSIGTGARSALGSAATSGHRVHGGAGLDPVDPGTPRRTARASDSVAGPCTAHRLGRTRAGSRRPRRLSHFARRGVDDRHAQPLRRSCFTVRTSARFADSRLQDRPAPTRMPRPRMSWEGSSAPAGEGRIPPAQFSRSLLVIGSARPTLAEARSADLSLTLGRGSRSIRGA